MKIYYIIFVLALYACLNANDLSPGNIHSITSVNNLNSAETTEIVLDSLGNEGIFKIPEKWKNQKKLSNYEHMNLKLFYLEKDEKYEEAIYAISISVHYEVIFVYYGESRITALNVFSKKERELIKIRVEDEITNVIHQKATELGLK